MVVPLGVLGIIVALVVWHKRRARRGAKAVGEVGVGDVVDLPPRGAEAHREQSRSQTPPPPYEARES